MIETVLKWSFTVVFAVFVVALAYSLCYGLYLVWNPEQFTEYSGRALSTGLAIVFAALFYTGLCDAWFRITKGK